MCEYIRCIGVMVSQHQSLPFYRETRCAIEPFTSLDPVLSLYSCHIHIILHS